MNLSAWCYSAGYLSGIAAFLLMARARRIAPGAAIALVMVGVLGGLVAANLAERIIDGTPGKTVLGAMVGGYLAVAIYKRAIGLTRPTGDLFAVAMCVGEAIGRWGRFFGGCCYGRPARLPWAVWQHGAWRHPTQIYLSLASALILVVLWRLARREPPENTLFFAQGALYCGARFLIEYWRMAPAVAGGLTAAQWACIAGFIYFAGRLYMLIKRPVAALASV